MQTPEVEEGKEGKSRHETLKSVHTKRGEGKEYREEAGMKMATNKKLENPGTSDDDGEREHGSFVVRFGEA